MHILNDGYQASYIILLPFIAKDLGLSLTSVGSLGTILNVAGILLALPAAFLAARLGGLKALLIAMAFYAAALVGVSSSPSLSWLLVMFAVGGIGFGVFHPVAFALIAKWTPKEIRGRTMGNFTAIGDLGRIAISAALTFVVVLIGWRQSVLIYALVALILAGLFFHRLRKSADVPAQTVHEQSKLSLWQVARNKRYLLALSAGALDSFASASLFVFLPFLLLKRGVSPAFLGTFTATFFAGNFFGKAVLGRFVDKFGGTKVFIASELLMAAFIFLLANSTQMVFIIACSVVLGIFTKGTVPVLQSMVSESVEHHGNFEKAFGMGAITSGIAVTLAPILLGLASDRFGVISAFNIMALAAMLAVAPAVLFFLVKPADKQIQKPLQARNNYL